MDKRCHMGHGRSAGAAWVKKGAWGYGRRMLGELGSGQRGCMVDEQEVLCGLTRHGEKHTLGKMPGWGGTCWGE